MKKVIRLTERDLTRVVKQIIKEYGAYEKSIDDLESSFEKKYDNKFLRFRDDDTGIDSYYPESETDTVQRKDHENKIEKLKTFYREKIIYDFLKNINLTPEENDRLEDLDERLSNPNLGSDKIERYKNLKRQIYLGHLNKYLNSLDNKYFGEYFISNNYDYFKDKIKDFAYNGNFPSEPIAPTYPNLLQRAANKVKGYFGLSENKRLTESDLTRIVKRVIKENDSYDLKMDYLKKMNNYKDDLETDRYLDQYDIDKGEVKRGEFRTHPGGQRQIYRFLNGVITRLSKMLKDFKQESNSSEDYEHLLKRAFHIYNDFAEKVGESHAMSDEEAFSKFQNDIEKEFRYDL